VRHLEPKRLALLLSLIMARMKIYTVDYTDKDGIVQYDYTFQAINSKEAKQKAHYYKIYGLPYPGPGKLKTIINLTGKL